MEGIPQQQLLEAGVHFGHLKKKWNPKMLPYIFMEHKGIHIIDLNKTNEALIRSAQVMKNIAVSGRKILFVATKKQAREIVAKAANEVGMPYVTERWLGGMLTNFTTIKKSIKKMQSVEKLLSDDSSNLTKKERLMLAREKEKQERVLGGIANLNRPPSALFIVDISYEHIALAEAKKLNIATFGMVDTNSDPTTVDFPIPCNDDASKSVDLIVNYLKDAIKEGLIERQTKMQSGEIVEQQESGGKDSGSRDDKEGGGKSRRRARGSRRRGRSGRREGGSNDAGKND